MADYGQILPAEPTDFSDRLRCGCERKSRVGELQQEDGLRPMQQKSEGTLFSSGADTHPAWWTHTDSQAPVHLHHRGGISAPVPERKKKKNFLNGAEK